MLFLPPFVNCVLARDFLQADELSQWILSIPQILPEYFCHGHFVDWRTYLNFSAFTFASQRWRLGNLTKSLCCASSFILRLTSCYFCHYVHECWPGLLRQANQVFHAYFTSLPFFQLLWTICKLLCHVMTSLDPDLTMSSPSRQYHSHGHKNWLMLSWKTQIDLLWYILPAHHKLLSAFGHVWQT